MRGGRSVACAEGDQEGGRVVGSVDEAVVPTPTMERGQKLVRTRLPHLPQLGDGDQRLHRRTAGACVTQSVRPQMRRRAPRKNGRALK